MKTSTWNMLVPFLFLLGPHFNAYADLVRHWHSIEVPGAFCGDGSPYSVFYDLRDPRRVAFTMMGGGACWDEESCLGLNRRAWIHNDAMMIDLGGFLSASPRVSAVSDYSMIFFPYCTGDVHLGHHVAKYKKHYVYHVGRENISLSLQLLIKEKIIKFADIEDFVLYGLSAGALGAMYHVFDFDAALPITARRSMIADSPGLHWGKDFWSQFPQSFVDDLGEAMSRVHYSLSKSSGTIADLAPALCKALPQWNIGFIQGTRDIVMSLVFGKTTAAEHREAVLGPNGIYALTRNPKDNCVSWVAESAIHTFLYSTSTSLDPEIRGLSSAEFARNIIERISGSNWR